MNEKTIKNWIKKKYLFPVSILLIVIGLGSQCLVGNSYANIVIANIGFMLAIIQLISIYINLEVINRNFPNMYTWFYIVLIYLFTTELPKFTKYFLEFACKEIKHLIL